MAAKKLFSAEPTAPEPTIDVTPLASSDPSLSADSTRDAAQESMSDATILEPTISPRDLEPARSSSTEKNTDVTLMDAALRGAGVGPSATQAENDGTLLADLSDSGFDDHAVDLTCSTAGASQADDATLDSGEKSPIELSGQVTIRDDEGPLTGRSLGRYRLIRLLGQGAFGMVYLAKDPQLDRDVAIKVTKTGVLPQRRDVDRFLREARSAAQLRHPNIVPVYEYGDVGGTNFIAYQFIKGRTLKSYLIQKRSLEPTEAAKLLVKLARALHYAHSIGIIHRDMKPDNVLLDEQGEPHIADFGLARREDSGDGRTIEGSLMGTPAYMSPEQASGQASTADGRSDVWSLGVMLEEMLTGVRPFEGSVTEVLVAVRYHEPKPLRQLKENLPQDLETIVSKSLAKKLEERFSSAELLADELDRWLQGEPILSRPISVWSRLGRWAKRNPQVAGLLGMVCGTLLLGVTVSSYFAWQASRQAAMLTAEKRDKALMMARSLVTSEPAAVEQTLVALADSASTIAPALVQSFAASKDDPLVRRRTAVALLALTPDAAGADGWREALGESMQTADAEELLMLADLGAPEADRLEKPLWRVAESPEFPTAARLRAASVLAFWKKDPARWKPLAPTVVTELTGESPFVIAKWIQLLHPARESLAGELASLLTAETSVDNQRIAATLLGRMLTDRPERLLELVEASPSEQIPLLVAGESLVRLDFLKRLEGLWMERQPPEQLPYAERAVAARRQANLLLAMLHLRQPEACWNALRMRESAGLTAAFLDQLSRSRVRPEVLLAGLEQQSAPAILRVLCLALGDFRASELAAAGQRGWSDRMDQLRKTHAHPGVRSAAAWAASRWGWPAAEAATGTQFDDAAGLGTIGDPAVGPMILVRGGVTFRMGSASDEPFHSPIEEMHERLLPRSFGIATHEVTVAEFLRFRKDHVANEQASPEESCPVNDVSWFDAVQYCRWLSERAGLPESEMVYPPMDTIGPQMVLAPEVLDRAGYRLPTAAEWEFCARSGSPGSFSSGEDLKLLEAYAWGETNSQRRGWPVATRRPNGFGMFDAHGNVIEWCHNWYFDELPESAAGVNAIYRDGDETRAGIYRELRGGSFDGNPEVLRLADRDYDAPGGNSYIIGFRVARTVKDPLYAPRSGRR